MLNDLALAIAFCLHGNRWLNDDSGSPAPELLKENSTFRYVRELEAVSTMFPSIRGTSAWLSELRALGTTRLSVIAPDIPFAQSQELRQSTSAGFSNGQRWAVLSEGHQSFLWRDRWTLNDLEAVDGRIWDVSYEADLDAFPERVLPDIESIMERLLHALHTMEALTRDAMPDWSNLFALAAREATNDDPSFGAYPDIVPANGIDLRSQQLLAVAVKSWVFDGMGSWADSSNPETHASLDKTKLDQTTDELFRSTMLALSAITSSSGAED